MRGTRRSLVVAIPLAAMLVASCGESSSAEGIQAAQPAAAAVEKMVARPAAMPAAAAAPMAAPTAAPAAVQRSVQVEKVVTQVVATADPGTTGSVVQEAVPADGAPSQTSTGSLLTAETQVPNAARKVIRTANIGIVVADVPTSVKAIRSIAASISGAYVSHTEIGGNEPYRISSITLRVPAERFDETVERIRAHGREVVAEDVTGRDVTAAFTDIESRLRNAQATEQQLLEIMATSRTVKDTLEVQREVAQVREQIETFQGQLNVLADQAALSTVTVNLHPIPDLRVERRAPDQYSMHDSVEFPISVINDGTVELRKVIVRDQLDPGLVFQNATKPGQYDQSTHSVVWTIDRMAPGQSLELRTRVRLEGDGQAMRLSAEASTDSDVRNTEQDQAGVTLPFFVDLSLQQDPDLEIEIDQELTMVLNYSNRGNGDARDVRLVERLPAGMTFMRANRGGRLDTDRNEIVWEFPELSPGASGSVSYVVRLEADTGRQWLATSIESTESDRARVDNRRVTFITAIPKGEDGEFVVSESDDWDPGETVDNSVEVLTRIGQWTASAAIVLGIIVAPIAAVLGAVGLGALGVHRTVIRRIRRRMP